MSEEQLKAFLEKIKGDNSLQEKLEAAADSDAVLAIAKEAGFMISAEDLTKAQSEVSDEELEDATGGQFTLFDCLLGTDLWERRRKWSLVECTPAADD